MKSTITSGAGISRSMKGPPNFLQMFQTYQEFGQAVADGRFTFDLGPLNPAGCKQVGTELIPETLLKDSTAALYGKGADAVPDDILAAIAPILTESVVQLARKANFEAGSYVGTGESGSDHQSSLTFQFEPKIVIVSGGTNNSGSFMCISSVGGLSVHKTSGAEMNGANIHSELLQNTVTWYAAASTTAVKNQYQLNVEGRTYDYIALS